MHFVSSSIYYKARKLALKEGLDAKTFDHHDVIPAVVNQATYLPIDLLFEVYKSADELLSSGFTLRQGQQLSSSDYGTLGLAWRTCWEAKEIFVRTARFMVLVTDYGSAKILEKGDETVIQLLRPTPHRGLEMANETTFVMLTNILKEVTGKSIQPTKVHFKHSFSDSRPFQEYFNCEVRFMSSENSMSFFRKDLEVPTLKADRQLQQYLVTRMQEEQKDIHSRADHLLKNIRNLVKESLPSGIPSLIQVADHVGMSPRTLKRRLSDKGASFRELVQELQKDVALEYLKNSNKSLSEITFLTGFSDPSAFNRAFKRWTGQAPSSFR